MSEKYTDEETECIDIIKPEMGKAIANSNKLIEGFQEEMSAKFRTVIMQKEIDKIKSSGLCDGITINPIINKDDTSYEVSLNTPTNLATAKNNLTP